MDIDSTAEVAKGLSDTGTVAILLFLLLGFAIVIALGMAWAGKRLLGQDGIVPKIATAHIQFLQRLEDALNKNVDCQRDHAMTAKKIDSTLKRLLEVQKSTDDRMNTLHRLWRHHVRFLEKIAVSVDRQDIVDKLHELDFDRNETEEEDQ